MDHRVKLTSLINLQRQMSHIKKTKKNERIHQIFHFNFQNFLPKMFSPFSLNIINLFFYYNARNFQDLSIVLSLDPTPPLTIGLSL